MIELGGNIKLVGFKELEPAQLIVIKKIVGNFAKKLNDHKGTFEELTLDLKSVHNSNHEIHGKIVKEGKVIAAEVTDYNLFFALDKVLKKLDAGL